MKPILPTAITALILCGAAPAFAADPQAAVTVRYGDLNTTAPAGAAALLQRIDQATLVLCGGRPDVRAIAEFQRFQACRAAARGRAVGELGQPMLAALANHTAGR
ncbi:MAG: UrcA family protein [Proteobacteria bacterium]|nr:UrcA family protein [Pseudomonadota bacterium]